MDRCSECTMPMYGSEKCACNSRVCYHCCNCDENCLCGCKKKEADEKKHVGCKHCEAKQK